MLIVCKSDRRKSKCLTFMSLKINILAFYEYKKNVNSM